MWRLTENDIVTFRFTPEEQSKVNEMAENCWLGSEDAQHATRGTRQEDSTQYLWDQETGQYGELALHKIIFGDEDNEGLRRYLLQREQRNVNKYEGDQGSDLWLPELPQYRVDAKTSTMRSRQDPFFYYLIVRPRDYHEDTDYVLMMRPKNAVPTIQIVGWCNTSELQWDASGKFPGAYTISAEFLHSPEKLVEKILAKLS